MEAHNNCTPIKEHLEIRCEINSAMSAAIRLPPGRPLMWMMLMHLQINHKLDDDELMMMSQLFKFSQLSILKHNINA